MCAEAERPAVPCGTAFVESETRVQGVNVLKSSTIVMTCCPPGLQGC